MFNTARFNLQRFNLTSSNDNDLPLKAEFSEAFYALVGTSENVYIADILAEQINQSSYLDPGEHASGIMAELLNAKIAIASDVPLRSTLSEVFRGDILVGQDSYTVIDFAASFMGNAYISCDSYTSALMADEILGSFDLGGDYPMPPVIMYEIFDGQVTSTQFNNYVASFDIALPPGSKLSIDSDNFVVLLDGENVIHLHNGDWLRLCRDTYDVQIQMGQEVPFSITMIYQERYL